METSESEDGGDSTHDSPLSQLAADQEEEDQLVCATSDVEKEFLAGRMGNREGEEDDSEADEEIDLRPSSRLVDGHTPPPAAAGTPVPKRAPRAKWRLIGLLALRRHLRDQSPTCNDDADALHHFNFFIRLEADEGTIRRYAGIADYIAEQRWVEHVVRVRIHGLKDADAPPPALTLRRAQVVASPLVSAVLSELIERLHNLRRYIPYAVQVTKDELYVGRDRPPICPPHQIAPEYVCPLCQNFQSHPVLMATCFHTFCFVCIRHHFNDTFRCPSCDALQHGPPRSLSRQKEEISAAISPLVDTSLVTGNWLGLRFPEQTWTSDAWLGPD